MPSGNIKITTQIKISETELKKTDAGPDLSSYSKIDSAWFKDTYPSVADGSKFLEIVPLYETTSKNRFKYNKKSIQEFGEKIVGKNGYMGHVDKYQQRTLYRVPVVKYVASKMTDITTPDGKIVKGAAVLAYVSKTPAGQDLYTNIKESMAGNVSIDGDAIITYVGDEKVIESWVDVESIDFVNNSLESVKGAGVTAIVQESFTENDSGRSASATSEERDKRPMEFTLAQIQESASGREVIQRITNDARSELVKVHEQKTAELNGEISTLKKSMDTATEDIKSKDVEIKKVTEQRDSFAKRLGVAELKVARNARFSELLAAENDAAKKENREAEVKVIEMAMKRVPEGDVEKFLVAGDDENYTKSKSSIINQINTEFAVVQEMRANFGAPKSEQVTTVVTESVNKTGTGTNTSSITLDDIFAPTIAANKEKLKTAQAAK